jgi:hypothetical protein
MRNASFRPDDENVKGLNGNHADTVEQKLCWLWRKYWNSKVYTYNVIFLSSLFAWLLVHIYKRRSEYHQSCFSIVYYLSGVCKIKYIY